MTNDGRAEDPRIVARQRRLEGGGRRGSTGRTIGAVVMLGLFAFGAAFIVMPEQIRSLFIGTSESEEFQSTSTVDPGLTTRFSTPDAIDTDGTVGADTAMEMPTQGQGRSSTPAAREEDRAQLAELQAQLDQLIAAQGDRGVDPAELETLLEAQADRLRAEFEQQRGLQQDLHDQQMAAARAAAVPTGPSPADITAQEARQRLEEERARQAAIEDEQVQSPTLLFDGGGGVIAPGGRNGDERERTNDEAFLAAETRRTHDTVRAARIPDPSRTLVQGTVIEAILETALTTELPGSLRAITSVDVYAYDGSQVLLPRGSRLIGSYNSDVSIAQNRVLIAWTRAITPDGVSVALGGVGGDALGRSGQTGFVDTRFNLRFGTAALISFLGIAPVLLVDDDSGEAEQELSEDIAQDLRNTTSSVLDDYLSLPPIILVDQGAELTVFVNRDLVF